MIDWPIAGGVKLAQVTDASILSRSRAAANEIWNHENEKAGGTTGDNQDFSCSGHMISPTESILRAKHAPAPDLLRFDHVLAATEQSGGEDEGR
jgi:hypothetical protein